MTPNPYADVYALILPVAALLVLLLVRGLRLRRALARVPVRIHVGGSRGKSAVCRLIATGLRNAGMRTLAKTTGTDPLLILPDGRTRPWPRLGPATIAEQRRFAQIAARTGAQATVLECMAIRPDLVRASERDLVRATIAVITNLRPDHLEDLPNREAVIEGARALVPDRGVLVGSRDTLIPELLAHAAARGTSVIAVDTAGLAISDANCALARAVCTVAGVPSPSFAGAHSSTDPGAFSVSECELRGRRIRFANAFACNDTESFGRLWRSEATQDAHRAVALLNHRSDRPLRSLQFLDFFAAQPERPRLMLLGGTIWLRRAARRRGLEVLPLRVHPWTSGAGLIESLAAAVPEGTILWGAGNYHGAGKRIARELLARSEAACSR